MVWKWFYFCDEILKSSVQNKYGLTDCMRVDLINLFGPPQMSVLGTNSFIGIFS